MSLKLFKESFFRGNDLTHLNNAGLAPISKQARDTVNYWSERFYREGFYTDADYMAAVRNTRLSLAKLVGCQWDEIAFFSSTAGGINQIAFSLSLQSGDEVLMWDQEYSSHLYPWKEAATRRGAHLKIVSSSKNDFATPTELFLQSITEKTKVVAFSWMQFQTGAMMDYAAVIKFCKDRGIFVFVDAMQGLGILPCDLWTLGVDALAGGSHKWLVSPVGVGFLAIRKEHALVFKPHLLGAYTYGTCDDPSDFACEPKRDATKFEPGSKQVLEITALGASTDLINSVGVEVLLAEANLLAGSLRDGLRNMGYQVLANDRNPIVNFWSDKKNIEDIARALTHSQINFARRGPGLRLSPHAFNNLDDIQKTLSALSLD